MINTAWKNLSNILLSLRQMIRKGIYCVKLEHLEDPNVTFTFFHAGEKIKERR
jgi:hypothetical protein